jgi:hypothetical protein
MTPIPLKKATRFKILQFDPMLKIQQFEQITACLRSTLDLRLGPVRNRIIFSFRSELDMQRGDFGQYRDLTVCSPATKRGALRALGRPEIEGITYQR